MNAEKDERKYRFRQCLVFGFLLCVLLMLHLLIQTDFGDDEYYRESWNVMSLGSFLKSRYEAWSSRLVIESVMMLLVAAPQWVWKILNSLVVLLLIWNTADLFGMNRKKIQAAVMFVVMIWVIPSLAIQGAGWITTSTNYLWPLSFGLVAIRPLKHFLYEEKCPGWEYFVVPLCVVYAANIEQMAAILLGAYLVVGLYQVIRKRKLSAFYYICILMIVVMLFFILLCPGNMNRLATETERFFPEFAGYSIWEKLFLGFIENVNYFASAGYYKTNHLFALLTGILAAGVLQRKLQGDSARHPFWLEISVALIPPAYYWGVGKYANYWLEMVGFRKGGHIVGLLCQNRYLPGTRQFSWGTVTYSWGMLFLQFCVYAGLIACVALSVYFLHGKSGETLLELVVLSVGMASHVIMGFSPTIYISSERTALFCDLAILIVAMRNLQMFWGSSKWIPGKILMGIYIAVNVLGNPSFEMVFYAVTHMYKFL